MREFDIVVSEEDRPALTALFEEVQRLQREVETKSAVALSNKRAHQVAYEHSERLSARIEKAVDLLARAIGRVTFVETRTREDRDTLVFVQDQMYAAMVTLDPKLGEVSGASHS